MERSCRGNELWIDNREGIINRIVSDLLPQDPDSQLLLLLRRPGILRREVPAGTRYSNIGWVIRCAVEAEIRTLVEGIAKRVRSQREYDNGGK